MGVQISMTDSEFFIGVNEVRFVEAKFLHPLREMGWEFDTDEFGNICDIRGRDLDRMGDEDAMFFNLAPCVRAGSYIQMETDEDRGLWRWVFDGSTCSRAYPDIEYPAAQSVPDPLYLVMIDEGDGWEFSIKPYPGNDAPLDFAKLAFYDGDAKPDLAQYSPGYSRDVVAFIIPMDDMIECPVDAVRNQHLRFCTEIQTKLANERHAEKEQLERAEYERLKEKYGDI